MLNVAELKKVMRERTNSGGSQSGRGSSKRKAPKGAITHLLTLTPQQAAAKAAQEAEVEDNTNNNQRFTLPTPVR